MNPVTEPIVELLSRLLPNLAAANGEILLYIERVRRHGDSYLFFQFVSGRWMLIKGLVHEDREVEFQVEDLDSFGLWELATLEDAHIITYEEYSVEQEEQHKITLKESEERQKEIARGWFKKYPELKEELLRENEEK